MAADGSVQSGQQERRPGDVAPAAADQPRPATATGRRNDAGSLETLAPRGSPRDTIYQELTNGGGNWRSADLLVATGTRLGMPWGRGDSPDPESQGSAFEVAATLYLGAGRHDAAFSALKGAKLAYEDLAVQAGKAEAGSAAEAHAQDLGLGVYALRAQVGLHRYLQRERRGSDGMRLLAEAAADLSVADRPPGDSRPPIFEVELAKAMRARVESRHGSTDARRQASAPSLRRARAALEASEAADSLAAAMLALRHGRLELEWALHGLQAGRMQDATTHFHAALDRSTRSAWQASPRPPTRDWRTRMRR